MIIIIISAVYATAGKWPPQTFQLHSIINVEMILSDKFVDDQAKIGDTFKVKQRYSLSFGPKWSEKFVDKTAYRFSFKYQQHLSS